MLPSRTEQLDDWLGAPISARCADDRYEVRRATPDDHPAIFGLLDEAFGQRRPRAEREWLYRRNPQGGARCWITIERATGEIVANETRWPWPFARGDEALRGEMIGDAAVTPRLQRRDVGDLRAPFRKAHPWYAETTAISWPNEASRRAAQKHGYAHRLHGPLPSAVLAIDPRALVEARLPRTLRHAAPALAVPVEAYLSWGQRRLSRRTSVRVERIARFDAEFDLVTRSGMWTREYWSPHAADFLAWRYLEHPRHEYIALAALARDVPTGYAVVRVGGETALLMELVVADAAAEGVALLAAVRSVAREAGCARVEFFSTAGFRHWPLLRRLGFLMRPSARWVQARAPVERPISAWQLVPGDVDAM